MTEEINLKDIPELKNLLRQVEYKTKKHDRYNRFNTYETTTIKNNMKCNGITYDFGDEKAMLLHDSSVSINCCNEKCEMETDIVFDTEDYPTDVLALDPISKAVNNSSCRITEIHNNDLELHVHTKCEANINTIIDVAKKINHAIFEF